MAATRVGRFAEHLALGLVRAERGISVFVCYDRGFDDHPRRQGATLVGSPLFRGVRCEKDHVSRVPESTR